MTFDGTIVKWNDDRGFGFIRPDQGHAELFAHISAFPKGEERPKVGEHVTFEVTTTSDGKKRAVNISFPTRAPSIRRVAQTHRKTSTILRSLSHVVSLAMLIAVAFYGYREFAHQGFRFASVQEPIAVRHDTQPQFTCDGRIHCSQMTSCAEATYFLNHCPGVEMDGDYDGTPCERQWCR